MRRSISAFAFVALAAVSLSPPVAAAEGPTLTLARQLQLATAHLASTAGSAEPALAADDQTALRELAAVAAGFRWELEGAPVGFEMVGAYAQLQRRFLAARAAVPADAPKAVRNDLLRVHSLMNRLDRRFGGTGFWSGRDGYSG